ncbi:MAG: hypothetical protein ACQESG_02490 [Nanobdellota archaeon]
MKRLSLILAFCILCSIAIADIGPKPSADIQVTLEGQKIPGTFNAKMLTCQEEQYGVSDMIPELNLSIPDAGRDCSWRPTGLAWGGECTDSRCHFGYFVPSEFRLAVYLPEEDTVYVSPETTRENFRSTFVADLQADGDIIIKETTPFMQSNSFEDIRNFFFALAITLILELGVALLIIKLLKGSLRVVMWVGVANVITLPIVWFVFPLIKPAGLALLLAELFAFVFEAYFLHFIGKMTVKRSFILSLCMNMCSLIVGGIIYIAASLLFYI